MALALLARQCKIIEIAVAARDDVAGGTGVTDEVVDLGGAMGRP